MENDEKLLLEMNYIYEKGKGFLNKYLKNPDGTRGAIIEHCDILRPETLLAMGIEPGDFGKLLKKGDILIYVHVEGNNVKETSRWIKDSTN